MNIVVRTGIDGFRAFFMGAGEGGGDITLKSSGGTDLTILQHLALQYCTGSLFKQLSLSLCAQHLGEGNPSATADNFDDFENETTDGSPRTQLSFHCPSFTNLIK